MPQCAGLIEPTTNPGRFLKGEHVNLGIMAIAAILTLPSLGVGWVADDNLQRFRFTGSTKLPDINPDPSEFFTFADGDPEHTARLMDLGVWPWWTYEKLHAAFWRPLAVFTHRVDYSFWPNQPVLMHAQNIGWYLALVGLVSSFFRRMFGKSGVAGLAALLYAVDDARGMPVGFLANRNALMASLLGVGAILLHDRWRRDNWTWGALFAPLAFAAGLLASEFGIGALGYIVAHVVLLDRGPLVRRWRVALPYIAVLAVWRTAWHLAGAGIDGVGLYVDPLTEPTRFLSEAAARAPILLLAQLGLPPSELYMVSAEFGWVSAHGLIAAVVIVPIITLLWPTIRHDSIGRFCALGMVLAVVPICATFPADRLLLFVGLGAFGLIARFLDGARRFGFARAGAIGFVVAHGVIAPIGLVLRSAMPVGPPSIMEGILIPPIHDPSIERKSVVVVTAPIVLAASYLPFNQALAGLPVPETVRFLAQYRPPVEIHRADDRSLILRPNGGFLKSPWDRLARNERHPLFLGDRVELAGMSVEVLAVTDDGRPAEAMFRFDRSLEDNSLHWIAWGPRGYESFVPPVYGNSVFLGR